SPSAAHSTLTPFSVSLASSFSSRSGRLCRARRRAARPCWRSAAASVVSPIAVIRLFTARVVPRSRAICSELSRRATLALLEKALALASISLALLAEGSRQHLGDVDDSARRLLAAQAPIHLRQAACVTRHNEIDP